MYDLEKLANDLAAYVEKGALTEENAMTIYEAACIKNESIDEDITESADDDEYDLSEDEMTLEAALDILAMEEAEDEEESSDSEDVDVAEAKKSKKETAKKVAKVLAITTVASAAVVGGGIALLSADDKARANKLASLKTKAKALNDKACTSDYTLVGNESDKEIKKKYKKILSLQNEINNLENDVNKYSSPSLLKKLQSSAAGKKLYTSKLAQKIANKKTDKMLTKATNALANGHISNIELDAVAKQAREISKRHGIKTANESVSDLDLINQFLEERIQEACSECDPTKNVENEITEKLPTVTPNESDVPADDPSIEKTDKAIEDAKKDLDVAGKLAEMRSAHELEKDTTQQHEAIKQALESVEDYVNDTKLTIYESAEAGLISEEEKFNLLEMINNL